MEKLITVSAALSTGAIQPNDYFSIPDTYDVAGSIFSDAWAHPTLDWSVSDIIAHSSDIGTIEIAQRLGLPRLCSTFTTSGSGNRPTSVSPVSPPASCRHLIPMVGDNHSDGPNWARPGGYRGTNARLLTTPSRTAGRTFRPALVDGYIDADGQEHLFPAARSADG